MSRHPPNSSTPAPKAGASTGTIMKTMKVIDITRAIARPSKQSRTIATADTRAAAIAKPAVTRAASSSGKLAAIAHSALAAT